MFAARAFDPTLHGGFIAFGEPTVFIGGLPAARVGDPHVCPLAPPLLPPHVGGSISTGSKTVVIGGQAAARQLDLCGCCTAPLTLPKPPAGPPGPVSEVVAKKIETPDGQIIELGRVRTEKVDKDGDGSYDEQKLEVSGARVTDRYSPWDWLRYDRETRAGYYDASRTISEDPAETDGGVQHETGAGRDKHTLAIGGDEKNPLYKIDAQGKLFSAGSGFDSLVGHDGSRYGVALGAGGSGAAVSADVGVTADAGANPFMAPFALAARKYLGVNADVSVSVGGGLGEAGVSAGAWAFYENGRIKIGVSGKVAAALGVEGAVGMSFGVLEGRHLADYWEEPLEIDPEFAEFLIEKAKGVIAMQLFAAVPNAIAVGCPTVFIGG